MKTCKARFLFDTVHRESLLTGIGNDNLEHSFSVVYFNVRSQNKPYLCDLKAV